MVSVGYASKNNMRAQTILAFLHVGWDLVKGCWCFEGLTCLTHLLKEWQTSFCIIFLHSRNSFVPSASFIRQKDSAFKTYETDLPNNHVNLCQLLPFFWRKMPSPSRSVETWKNQNHATIGRSSTISLLRVTFSPGNKESTCHLHMVRFSWVDIRNGSISRGIHDHDIWYPSSFWRKLPTLSTWNSHQPRQPSCRCWSAQANITNAGATPKLTKSPETASCRKVTPPKFTSWWFQPIQKKIVEMGIFAR